MKSRLLSLAAALLLALSAAACGGRAQVPATPDGALLSSGGPDASASAAVPPEPQSPPPREASSQEAEPPPEGSEAPGDAAPELLVRVRAEAGADILFRLNHSPAAGSLYRQLPLTVNLEDYGGSEKIFYPPEALDTSGTPLAQGPAGTLAYYEPWGDVALFYGACGGAAGLYALGEAVSGAHLISTLTGEAHIERAEEAKNEAPEPAPSQGEPQGMPKLQITAGGQRFSATLYDSETARALVPLLPLTVQMDEMNGNEKYCYLPQGLPTSAARPKEIRAGDLMLYGSDCLVLFYESFTSSYSYTPLGRVEDPAGLAGALGAGDVEVSFQLAE